MIVHKIRMQNFGSLRDVLLDKLGNFVVLLGKNGSGKSFLFEALHLFFNEFNTIGGATAVGTDDNLWHGRITTEPVQIDLTLAFNDGEIRRIFALPGKLLDNIKKACSSEEAFRQIEISRSITFNGNWRTNYMKWADIEIIKDDETVGTEKLATLQQKPQTLNAYQFAFFTPEYSADNIGGDRLLLHPAKKVAYYSNAQIDSLVSIGVIKAVKVYSAPAFKQITDWRAWATKEGYTIVEHPPTPEEAPQIHEALAKPAELTTAISQATSNLTQLIKGNFKLIQAARDAQTTSGVRTPLLEQSTLDLLKELSVSRKPRDERKWNRYRSGAEPLIKKNLEPNPEQLLIRDGGLRLPPAYIGGGEQEILAFRWWFLNDKEIFAIEEPENHLHPKLCREIYRFLKQQSQSHQVFLSTHSPMFADKTDIRNNWVMMYQRSQEEEYGESKIQQIETRGDLKLALAELGVLPSDIYLKDFIVFVEGGTEQMAILPILGSKLGVNMEDNIGVLNIGGDSNLEHYLRVYLEIAEYAPADYMVVLDKHSSNLVLTLSKEMGIETNKFRVWQKGSIEDYYPQDIAIEALKELFGVEIDTKGINKREPLDKELKRILESQGKIRKRWKVEIGTYVAEKIEIKNIHREIKDVFNFIKSHVEN